MEWLGRVPYAEALAIQEQRVETRRRGATPDALLLLEHPPVVTLGRAAREENLCVEPSGLAARGVELHRISRGGDVTYHGPGQLVGYPILDLQARGTPDVIAFLRRLEEVLIDALAELGLEGYARPGYTGVFVGPGSAGPPRKIASIGVGLRGWVTYHGFALNVTLDPAEFELIVPCGLRDVSMTSIERELGRAGDADGPESSRDLDSRVRGLVARHFRRAFAPVSATGPLDSATALR